VTIWTIAVLSLCARAAEVAVPALPPSAVTGAWAHATDLSARISDAQGLPAEGYGIYRENMARYLYNAYPDAQLSALNASGAKSVAELPQVPRWTDKLERDAAKPYSDAQVGEHLDRLQGELVDAIKMLRGFNSEASFRLVLMGGLPRGRFSANSDLDVVLKTEDHELFAKAMESPYGYLVKERFVILSPAARNKRVGRALGPTLDIDPKDAERPGFLREVYHGRRAAIDPANEPREIPHDKLATMMELKKLSKRALRHPPGSPEREAIEERMRVLSKSLE
jgi:hypothetical protein